MRRGVFVLGKIVSVISGKGGTGKTSLCAGIASCLAAEHQRVLCIDADVGLRNLDISLGMADEHILPFTAVMRGEYAIDKAAQHPSVEGLFLLTAPVLETPESLDVDAFGAMLESVRSDFDWIFIDAPAGVGAGFRLSTQFADLVLVVSNADPASLRDAARAAELLFSQRSVEAKLIVNRVRTKMFSQMNATVDDVMDAVGLPLLGIVPDDVNVTLAAAASKALILSTDRGAARACLNIARRLCGRKMPLIRL
ncbi:MAG: AAA family ATPase [Oscillospiraceae bacterium]|nr:AAA family ATPase [Oscillospiraceae bacterium]